jgi:hypothetical protein
MRTSAARILREDDQQDMSREAVLLQWERKIEAAERRPARFGREDGQDEATVEELQPARERAAARRSAEVPTADSTHEGDQHFERVATAGPTSAPAAAERRTITITGQPTPARRRRSVIDSQMAQPDRIALWAFLLGLFLVVVAAGTAHA